MSGNELQKKCQLSIFLTGFIGRVINATIDFTTPSESGAVNDFVTAVLANMKFVSMFFFQISELKTSQKK